MRPQKGGHLGVFTCNHLLLFLNSKFITTKVYTYFSNKIEW